MDILVVAGEASGDQHGSELVGELQRRDPSLRFFGMGGRKLSERGVELVYGAHEVSVMGIVEVLPKLRRILQVMAGLEGEAKKRKPALAILIDIPDFNLRLAAKLKKQGIRVAYYVSPMIWASRTGRVKQIAKVVDEMLCILPFEPDFYKVHGVTARYVGSPVVEQVPAPASTSEFRKRLGVQDRPTLALLPGSRMAEIRRILPTMVQAAKALLAEKGELQILVPVAPTIARQEITSRFEGSGVEPVLIDGKAPEAVGASDAAIVASGTAALEAGLMQRPFVVVYRVSWITYWIARRLLKVPYVALVNLLAGKRIVPELLQHEMTAERILTELRRVWSDGQERREMVAELTKVRESLGPPGAAGRAADAVIALLKR
ncbi:MAG: lipid-A-disaccharide synthase [Myxococcaceae bacterium]